MLPILPPQPTVSLLEATLACSSPMHAAAPAGTEVSLVTTVEDKRSNYSKADYSRAEQARLLQKSLMFPASKDLKSWLDKNIIRDCKLERRDVSAADDVFGPDVAILQGKTTRKKA
jgi:hypothetical protein